MLGNKIKILLFIGFTFAMNGEIHSIYNQALQAYQVGHFELAINNYENILNNEWESPQLYYNLRNAYYRSNKIGGAVWAYEQALRLDPNHEDASFNLKRVNIKVKDKVDIPSAPFYLKQYLALKERFTFSEWVTILFGLILAISFFYFLIQMFNPPYLSSVMSLLIVVSFAVTFFTIHSVYTSNSVFEGIIYKEKIEVNSEPNRQSIRIFEVHEGLKVSVRSQSNNWVEIELVDGKTGWIPEQSIRFIN